MYHDVLGGRPGVGAAGARATARRSGSRARGHLGRSRQPGHHVRRAHLPHPGRALLGGPDPGGHRGHAPPPLGWWTRQASSYRPQTPRTSRSRPRGVASAEADHVYLNLRSLLLLWLFMYVRVGRNNVFCNKGLIVVAFIASAMNGVV
jgi:hypothetical protein